MVARMKLGPESQNYSAVIHNSGRTHDIRSGRTMVKGVISGGDQDAKGVKPRLSLFHRRDDIDMQTALKRYMVLELVYMEETLERPSP